MLPSLDLEYLQATLTQLLLTPSPVGETEAGSQLCVDLLCQFACFRVETTRKGVVLAHWPGEKSDEPRAVTAHIDTLGAVVKTVKETGRLTLSQIGNYSWNSIENESVTVVTQDGTKYRGLVQVSNPSHHLYTAGNGNHDVPRAQETMEVRLDARASNPEDVAKLGIEIGDYIYLDPRPEWNEGFIRSRHLDDKALVACLLTAAKAICDAGLRPAQNTTLHIANYEEVGHGGSSGIPPETAQVLALDVAPTGIGQNGNEFSCTLAIADSDGPYDPKMRRHLRELAHIHDIALRPDVFPEYCSDGDALWKAGGDVQVALIGPGVDGTHSHERTHIDALEATAKMIVAYLLS
ncbi:MAG TPA: M42 family metallopeptidase [Abditibacterium sp.]|jgi:putative aminopeptidase FrvX